MEPIDQLNQLNTAIQQYVEKTGDQNLDHVFLRCITKGNSHTFQMVEKTFWNKVVIFFSLGKTKAQYNIVNNVAEIKKLFGAITAEDGVKLQSLETRLNGLIDHVLGRDALKGVERLNFVATFIQQKSQLDQKVARQQEELQQKAAKQKADQEEQQRLLKEREAQQKAQQEEMQRQAEQEAAEQKARQEEMERSKQEIQQHNAPLKSILNENQGLYKEVLGTELDTSQKVVPQIMENIAKLDGKLLALGKKSKYLFFSETTQYGKAGTPQALVLASVRSDLKNQVELLAKKKEDPAAFAKELEKSTELLSKINNLFIAQGSEENPKFETAKRMEIYLISNQLLHGIRELGNSRTVLFNTAFLVEFQKEVDTFRTCSWEELEKNLRTLGRGANNALSQYGETSTVPERKLLAGFVAFASELLGIDFNK